MSSFLKIEKFTGWHMLAVLVLFFGVIISVNLTLAWYANSTWTGLVVKNSYVASQEFNERTAERKRQIAMGWQSAIAYGKGKVTVTLAGPDGKPVIVDQLQAKLGHPAYEAQDRTLTFSAVGGGRYEADSELGAGLWQADLAAIDGSGESWEHSIRFTVAEGQ